MRSAIESLMRKPSTAEPVFSDTERHEAQMIQKDRQTALKTGKFLVKQIDQLLHHRGRAFQKKLRDEAKRTDHLSMRNKLITLIDQLNFPAGTDGSMITIDINEERTYNPTFIIYQHAGKAYGINVITQETKPNEASESYFRVRVSILPAIDFNEYYYPY